MLPNYLYLRVSILRILLLYVIIIICLPRGRVEREREREISLFARVTSTATDDSAVTKYIYHAKPAIFEQDVTR